MSRGMERELWGGLGCGGGIRSRDVLCGSGVLAPLRRDNLLFMLTFTLRCKERQMEHRKAFVVDFL